MLVAAIIPVFKQAQFLVESVSSVLAQTHAATNVVIVNDGCPDPASETYGMAYSALEPQRVSYVRQPNRGLAAARNAGVRHALQRWPGLQGFFFLDADNFLAPEAIGTMAASIDEDPSVGWVYSAMSRFGEASDDWWCETPANLFRMLFENQSDAGSLVGRRVFDAGIYFDESMRKGYEDWEFFIRALRGGFKGRSAGKCGFFYRVRRHSMLVESARQHDAVVGELRARHQDLLQPRELTRTEHQHCPRFLWAVEHDQIAFTDPDAIALPTPPQGYHPPVLILSSASTLAQLRRAKVLRSVLLLCQAQVSRGSVTIRFKETDNCLSIDACDAGDAHIVAFYSGKFEEPRGAAYSSAGFARTLKHAANFELALPGAAVPDPLGNADIERTLDRLSATGIFSQRVIPCRHDGAQASHRYFSWHRNCRKLETTYPYIGEGQPHIGFAVPWLKLGGVDLCVIHLAEAVRRIAPNVRLSLITTEGGVEYGAQAQKSFDDLICLQQSAPKQMSALCGATFRSMDMVVNAHSLAAYETFAARVGGKTAERFAKHIAYLHVVEEHRDKLVGFPYVAAAREEAIDGFAVISDNLKSFLVNQGIAPFRIKTVRNAPIVRPPTLSAARQLAADKAARLAAGAKPLRLLFAGRADYQKGIGRLKALVDRLARGKVPFELTFVGDAVMKAEVVRWPTRYVRTLPSTRDPSVLAEHYAHHDVYLLLSRWEGVPLALLDAMAHGCAVVATDVGAVRELVVDQKNGFLVAGGDDERVAEHAERIIQRILLDPTGNRDMREAAVDTAWSYSWDEAARTILSFMPGFETLSRDANVD